MSSILGTGVDEFFKAVDSAREEFLVEYLKDVEALKKKRLDMELKRYACTCTCIVLWVDIVVNKGRK